MPSPLEWLDAPLASRMALLRSGVPASWIRQTQRADDRGRQG